MLMAFIDESYNRLHYGTSGLVIDSSAARVLHRALDDVVLGAAESFDSLDRGAELHGHDIFHALNDWTGLHHMTRARIAVYRQSLVAVSAHAQALLIEGLDRESFRSQYDQRRDEHVAVLLHLLEKLDRYANKQDEDLLVVADEHHAAQAAQAALSSARDGGAWGFRGEPRRIVDTVYFVSSKMSRLVQAADLIAFLHQRVNDVGETDKRAVRANEHLWEQVVPLLHADRLWRPGSTAAPA